MKTLWILNHYAQTPDGPGGTRHFTLAKNLLGNGWCTYIFAAGVDHFTGKQRLNPKEDIRVDCIDGINFVWIRIPEYKGNGFSRIAGMLYFMRGVMKVRHLSSIQRPDVVVGSSVHLLAGYAGERLARHFQVPFVFEVRDLWPQTLVDFRKLSKLNPLTRCLYALEKYLYKKAVLVITLMPGASRYIESRGISQEKVVWLPNGVDLNEFQVTGMNSTAVETLGAKEAEVESGGGATDSGKFTLMYLGSHGEANGLEVLIRAWNLVLGRGYKGSLTLELVGDGPSKSGLMTLAKKLGMGGTDIVFRPSVPKKRVPQIAQKADAFVLLVKDLPMLYRYGISMNKIAEYMAMARPVIIASGAINNPIADSGCGVTAEPDNPSALADAIISLAQKSPVERQQMGENGVKYVRDNLSYYQISLRLAQLLDTLVSGSPGNQT